MASLDFRAAGLSFTGGVAPGTVTQHHFKSAAVNCAQQNALMPSALLGMRQVLATWLSQ